MTSFPDGYDYLELVLTPSVALAEPKISKCLFFESAMPSCYGATLAVQHRGHLQAGWRRSGLAVEVVSRAGEVHADKEQGGMGPSVVSFFVDAHMAHSDSSSGVSARTLSR